jgi:hypothetical protein
LAMICGWLPGLWVSLPAVDGKMSRVFCVQGERCPGEQFRSGAAKFGL